MANLLGYDSYMYYTNAPNIHSPCLYTEKYINLKRALDIEDSTQNVIFVPESIVSIREIRESLPNIRIVLCWLSFDFGKAMVEEHLSVPNIIHVFQSKYAQHMVTSSTSSTILGLEVQDYTHDDIVLQGWSVETKKNRVAYNPRKDTVTPQLCAELNIETVAITNMTPKEVIVALQDCKVYMDCGFHPGKDRLPREAASLGCVVVTNRCGSANFYEDVPILQRCTYAKDANTYIQNAFDHYSEALASQDHYRKIIAKEKYNMAVQMKKLFRLLNESS
jgi:hypothetical protein